MPSSPNYVRDYAREAQTAKARGERKDDVLRHRARRKLERKGLVRKHDGKDVDHKRPLSKGGAGTDAKNLRILPRSKNRSFARNPDGSMK